MALARKLEAAVETSHYRTLGLRDWSVVDAGEARTALRVSSREEQRLCESQSLWLPRAANYLIVRAVLFKRGSWLCRFRPDCERRPIPAGVTFHQFTPTDYYSRIDRMARATYLDINR